MRDDSDRLCCNCQAAHPAEPFQSEFAICLNSPEFEPYLDDILERQDFSRCQDLALRKRFAWDWAACDNFDPVEETGEKWPPELSARIEQLAENGRLTPGTLQEAILADCVARTDWSQAPVDGYLRKLREANTLAGQMEAVSPFGFLVGQGNKAAFDALCAYMRALPPASTVDEKALRIEILCALRATRDHKCELAVLLVEDLFRTASNQTTRGWYSEVFDFFEHSCPPEIAEEALRPMLDSQRFSHRVRRRIRAILDDQS